MIDTTKYPFKLDHSKCFNCQVVSNLSPDERDGKSHTSSTWQKGVHLCSSCQWHAGQLVLEVKSENVIKRELYRIEGTVSDYGIYFDEKTPLEAIKKLEAIVKSQPEEKVCISAIKDLKQIVELGFNKLVN